MPSPVSIWQLVAREHPGEAGTQVGGNTMGGAGGLAPRWGEASLRARGEAPLWCSAKPVLVAHWFGDTPDHRFKID